MCRAGQCFKSWKITELGNKLLYWLLVHSRPVGKENRLVYIVWNLHFNQNLMNLSTLHSSVNSFTSLFFSIGCLLSHFSHVRVYMTTRTIPTRILCPWDSPGKNTGVFCHFLLQGIFPTQGSNPSLLCLLHCKQILIKILKSWNSETEMLKII